MFPLFPFVSLSQYNRFSLVSSSFPCRPKQTKVICFSRRCLGKPLTFSLFFFYKTANLVKDKFSPSGSQSFKLSNNGLPFPFPLFLLRGKKACLPFFSVPFDCGACRSFVLLGSNGPFFFRKWQRCFFPFSRVPPLRYRLQCVQALRIGGKQVLIPFTSSTFPVSSNLHFTGLAVQAVLRSGKLFLSLLILF